MKWLFNWLFKAEEPVIKTIAEQAAADEYYKSLEKQTHELDGLYYSNISDRLFEAEVFNGLVFVTYADEDYPRFKEVPVGVFYHQLQDYSCYDKLIGYKEEGL